MADSRTAQRRRADSYVPHPRRVASGGAAPGTSVPSCRACPARQRLACKRRPPQAGAPTPAAEPFWPSRGGLRARASGTAAKPLQALGCQCARRCASAPAAPGRPRRRAGLPAAGACNAAGAPSAPLARAAGEQPQPRDTRDDRRATGSSATRSAGQTPRARLRAAADRRRWVQVSLVGNRGRFAAAWRRHAPAACPGSSAACGGRAVGTAAPYVCGARASPRPCDACRRLGKRGAPHHAGPASTVCEIPSPTAGAAMRGSQFGADSGRQPIPIGAIHRTRRGDRRGHEPTLSVCGA